MEVYASHERTTVVDRTLKSNSYQLFTFQNIVNRLAQILNDFYPTNEYRSGLKPTTVHSGQGK